MRVRLKRFHEGLEPWLKLVTVILLLPLVYHVVGEVYDEAEDKDGFGLYVVGVVLILFYWSFRCVVPIVRSALQSAGKDWVRLKRWWR